MSKIVSQMSGIVRNTESNRLCAAGRLSLKLPGPCPESGCKGRHFSGTCKSVAGFFLSGFRLRFIYNSINSAGTRGNQPFGRSPSECRSRKEVFQPHLPVRLPCYDLAPITSFTLGRPLRSFVESGCRLQSELRVVFGIRIRSPGSFPLYHPL